MLQVALYGVLAPTDLLRIRMTAWQVLKRPPWYCLTSRTKPLRSSVLYVTRPSPLRPCRAGHRTLFTSPSEHPVQRRKDVVRTSDTIYALSTAPGRAAIAVIRISGPACLDIYGGLCPDKSFPQPRTATLRKLYDPTRDEHDSARILDSGALVLYFPAPKTVTGEPILELHVHGGPAIVKSVLDAIPQCTDTRPRRRVAEYSLIRPAEPGEFTKRAFYNGRLDLTQAEALGETLAAETEQQRRLAVMGTESGLAKRYEEWRQMLLYARGELEALIDFSEDQHFDESPAEFVASVSKQVEALERLVSVHIRNASRGELLRNGISIALLGAPNAGKSSLLNRIVGREAAIVSAEAGTTRDIVDVSIDLSGWLCRIGDMAGLRKGSPSSTGGPSGQEVGFVEREGIRRARERALQSDVVLVILPVALDPNGKAVIAYNEEVLEAVHECRLALKKVIFVLTKADLIDDGVNLTTHGSNLRESLERMFPKAEGASFTDTAFPISCHGNAKLGPKDDPGKIQALLRSLTKIFPELTIANTGNEIATSLPEQSQSYWTASLSVTHRQKAYLEQCLGHLQDFLSQANPPSTHHTDNHADLVGDAEVDIVTAAEHLRYAASCLAKITGKGEGGDVEDVVGVVFEK